MKPCSRCGRSIAADALVCSHCGEAQPKGAGAFDATVMAPPRSPAAATPGGPAALDENKPTEVMTAVPDFAQRPGATASFNPSPSQLPRTRLHAATPAVTPPDAKGAGQGALPPKTKQQREPSGAHRPPILASESLREELYPTQPGRGAIRVWFLVAALLLGGSFAIPISLGKSPVFAWDLLGKLDGLGFAWALYPAAAAVLLLALAALPLPYVARGLLGVLVGGTAFVLVGLGGMKLGIGAIKQLEVWRLALFVAGVILVPAAWLHRRRYVKSVLARLVALLGAALIVVPLVVPTAGQVPLVGIVELARKGSSGVGLAVVAGAYLLIAATALLAFLPSSTRAGGGFFAVLALVVTPILVGLALLGIGDCPKGVASAAAAFCGDTARLLVARLGLFALGLHLVLTYGLAHVFAPLSAEKRAASVGKLAA
jgi:hypothetical protein